MILVVCNGDGSSCESGPTAPITSDVQLNQKTFCSIVESGCIITRLDATFTLSTALNQSLSLQNFHMYVHLQKLETG
jgi:hypothetical protein